MNQHIQNIAISNFKSIKDLKIDGCKKINIFAGKPNAGKSNILEALGLFGAINRLNQFSLKDFIRFGKAEYNSIFFEGNISEAITLKVNDSILHVYRKTEKYNTIDSHENSLTLFDDLIYDWKKINENINNFELKFYKFKEIDSYEFDLSNKLSYPFGKNIGEVISSNPKLRNDINQFFIQNNLKLLIEKNTNELKIFKEYQDGTVFTLPYNMIADTLQRLIFYKTAIMSNQDSVLLFEEPEAHCFEPYILEFTNDIKYNENNNQFFIVTHSDFIIQELLRDEESKNNTQIFLVNNVDGETKIKKLDAKKNEYVYEYGMNVFFNFENLWENN